jgi:hypothetical protein
LFMLQFTLFGVPAPSETRVEVLPGPAREAGMKDGDRVISVAGVPLRRFEDLHPAVERSQGPIVIEVERAGAKLEFEVQPRAARIGVARLFISRPVGMGEAARRGIVAPWIALSASVRQFAGGLGGGDDTVQLAGPVRTVKETSSAAETGSLLELAALLGTHVWPLLALIPFFDALTGRIFGALQRPVGALPQRVFRLGRRRQALQMAAVGCALAVLGAALSAAQLRVGVPLELVAAPLTMTVYPLVWLMGRELWGKAAAAVGLVGSALVPCIVLVVIWRLLVDARSAMGAEGYRVGWLRITPKTSAG